MVKVYAAIQDGAVLNLVNEAAQVLGWSEAESVNHLRDLGTKIGNGSGTAKVIVVDCGLIDHLSMSVEFATLARFAPGIPIFAVLGKKSGMRHAEQAVAAGAAASVPRNISLKQLQGILKLVDDGLTISVVEAGRVERPAPPREKLSVRELQVLQGICCGLQNKEIAHSFRIKEVTVKMHVRGIIRKLDARNRTHAAMIARDLGLVACDEHSFKKLVQ